MGLDSKLFELGPGAESPSVHHHDEVETTTIYRGPSPAHSHPGCDDNCPHKRIGDANGTIIDEDVQTLAESELIAALDSLSKETVWRVKGFVKLERGYCILNWAFGRYELTPVASVPDRTGGVKLTVMGERGEVKRAARKLATRIDAELA